MKTSIVSKVGSLILILVAAVFSSGCSGYEVVTKVEDHEGGILRITSKGRTQYELVQWRVLNDRGDIQGTGTKQLLGTGFYPSERAAFQGVVQAENIILLEIKDSEPTGIVADQIHGWRVGISGGDTLTGCLLQAIDDSLLTLTRRGEVISLPVDSIDFVSRRTTSRFWTGAGYGSVVGAIVGYMLGVGSYKEPAYGQMRIIDAGTVGLAMGILGGVGGFAVGGIVGAAASLDEMYKLSGRTHNNKLVVLRMVLKEEVTPPENCQMSPARIGKKRRSGFNIEVKPVGIRDDGP